MATLSCTIQKSDWYSVYLEYSYTQDKAKAKTTVTHALKLKQLTDSYDFDTVSEVTVGYKINGVTFSKTGRININDAGNTGYTITLASGTTTVSHTSEGKGSFTVAVATRIDSAGWGPGLINLNQTVDLPDIPRASVLDSVTGGPDLDDSITYKYTVKNAAFYNFIEIGLVVNNVAYYIREYKKGQQAAQQHSESITFDSDELDFFYDLAPNATKVTVQVQITTYTDSAYRTRAGDPSIAKVTLNIPSSEKPTVLLGASKVNDNSWIASKDIYVAGFSKVALSLTATPAQGTTIVSTAISGEGFTQSGTYLTVRLDKDGKFTFTGTATDTRDRSASRNVSITVLPYSAPLISSVQVDRGTYSSGWTANEKGPDVRVTFNATLSLTDYGNTYNTVFKLDGTNRSPDYGTTSSLTSGAAQTVYFTGVGNEASHLLNLTITDSVGKSGKGDIMIPTTLVTMEFNTSGKGIAFGKTSEKDAFECAWDAEFSGDLSLVGGAGQLIRIPEIQSGTVKIIPSAANTPTSIKVTFPKEFSGTPTVIVSPVGSIVGTTILGAGVTAYTSKDCLLWVTRTNTSETTLNWIAVY